VSGELEKRLAALPPEKRRLLELRLRKEGIAPARPGGPPAIPPRDPSNPGPFPLTFGQQRLWFIDQLNPGTAVYNIPFAGRLRGRLHAGLLERALREVVRRHEVLRTRFRLLDGGPVQVIDPEPFVRLPLLDLTALPDAPREAEATRVILAEPHAPFDLERGPVLRVSLVKMRGGPNFEESHPEGEGRAGRIWGKERSARPDPSARPSRQDDSLSGHVGTLRSQLPKLRDRAEKGAEGDAEEHVLLVTMPHLVTDAWSMGIFFRELPAIYEAFRRGRPSPLPELPVQMADYALWQRGRLQGEVLEEQLRFWRDYLRGAPPVLALPTDRPRPPAQTFNGKRLPMTLPPEVLRDLRPFNDRRGVTSFMTLLAMVDIFLQRWSGSDDILVGSPVVTRTQTETHPLIGFFINMAVLRGKLHGDPTFEELLARVRDSTLASLAHQDLPFERLAEAMDATRDPSYPPLVQVSFVLQNVQIPQPDFEGIRLVDSWQTDTGMARFDLGVGVFEEEGEGTIPQGGFDYNTDLFDEATVLRMRSHFLALAAGALAEPERRLSELPMLSAAESRQLLVEWNDELPAPRRLFHEIVADVAREQPEAPAVVGVDGTTTYAELVRRAGALAEHLRGLGVGPEVGVAVCLERSPERIIAFLAALTSGGFYTPLDPAWPAERLRYQLRDTRAAVVVMTEELAERFRFADEGVKVVLFEARHPDGEERAGRIWGEESSARPDPSARPSRQDDTRVATGGELAYVFYTSGSTGRPKGVMISHRGLANLAMALRPALGDAPGERVLQAAGMGFDASVYEMAVALPAGRALHIAGPGALLAGAELAALAKERAVSCCILTPTVLATVPEGALEGVDCIILGGEPIPSEMAARWASKVQLFNSYGPTEATVSSTLGFVEPGMLRPSIGHPLAGFPCYVLDTRLQPVPRGAHGELCIGGRSVARGYLGRPARTAAVFVPDALSGEPGARLYRTGDRARHLPDGRLELLGRLDGQIKVRGIRIEPGEIEAVLREHPAVREAVVLLHEGDGRLMACVVLAGQADREELRPWLRERLPEAMLPSLFVVLDSLPLTPNGKLDRRALSRLEPAEPAAPKAGAELPATEKERLLADLWARALKRDHVGRHDDFFAIGGDSILAIQVVARAAEAGIFVEPKQLFAHPTVAGLAAVAAGEPRIDAEQGPVTGPVPLTPIQRWFLEDVDPPVPDHWNLSVLLEAPHPPTPSPIPSPRPGEGEKSSLSSGGVGREEAPLSRGLGGDGRGDGGEGLARAVGRLLTHHDQLRARFHRTGAGWRQEIAPPGEAPFTLIDLSALPAAEAESRIAAAAVQASLDLQQGPLFRAVLLDLGADHPMRLLLTVHHLVMDGVSWPILLSGLLAAAAGSGLPPKTTSFQRWAERLREYARTAELRRELGFWREAGDRATPSPVDFPAVGRPTEGDAGRVEVRLGGEETRQLLTAVPEAWPVRAEEVLMTAVAEALAGWSGERTLTLAVEGHGRERLFDDVDLSRTVGWLTTSYPIRLELPAGDLGESLKAVKERLRRVPQRGIGYGVLRYLADDEAAAPLRRQPRPDVSFNYLGRMDDPAAGAGPFRLAPEPGGGASDPRNPRPHPLTVDAVALGDELRLVWVYDRGRYRRETVEQLAASTLGHLHGLIAHCLRGEASGHTPVDFPHAGLKTAQLEKLLEKVGGRR
jgi:amino acid adenylation domain-containing protein/non-ribosomal peptide synthase protein (TIGR01720 family)